MNTDWTRHAYFAALDWASDHHDVIVLDRAGAVQTEIRFAHTADGWTEFTTKLQPFTGAPITLETYSGPAVDQLLQRGWAVYPVAPIAAARYRERKVPSGTKTDRHDTWALADALRTDGHAWRPLRPQDEATAPLRALCRPPGKEKAAHFVKLVGKEEQITNHEGRAAPSIETVPREHSYNPLSAWVIG